MASQAADYTLPVTQLCAGSAAKPCAQSPRSKGKSPIRMAVPEALILLGALYQARKPIIT